MTAEDARTTLDESEARRFGETAGQWWNPAGPYRPLHKLNPARLAYIRKTLVRRFRRDAKGLRPLDGLSVLDIGCGGGLVCEPLARLGARVTGIDTSEESVTVARAHAEAMGLEIAYRATTAETLAEAGERFDAVLALEIVEHVADVPLFLQACRQLTEDQGALIFSTLNRTARAFALGIVAAEYVLGWVPRGTHDWRRFIKPEELEPLLGRAGFALRDTSGLVYDPFIDSWKLGRDTAVNYIGWAAPKT